MEQPALADWPAALISQLSVTMLPAKRFEPAEMLHPGPVWRVMLLPVCVLTPSIMSISPFDGHEGPTIQKAGQVPHMLPGIWARSSMTKPVL